MVLRNYAAIVGAAALDSNPVSRSKQTSRNPSGFLFCFGGLSQKLSQFAYAAFFSSAATKSSPKYWRVFSRSFYNPST